MTKPDNPVEMGVIGAAHGIRGEVRVKSFTDDPLALGDYGPLLSENGRVFVIAQIRAQKDVVVVRFEGVDDRNAAEALNGTRLFVERAALPEELDEEEFYHTDLIGLDVLDETDALVGKVKAVQNFGGGDIVEIVGAGRASVLVPFTRAAVPTIDIAAGRLIIDRKAAGLLDDEDEETGAGADPEKGAR